MMVVTYNYSGWCIRRIRPQFRDINPLVYGDAKYIFYSGYTRGKGYAATIALCKSLIDTLEKCRNATLTKE